MTVNPELATRFKKLRVRALRHMPFFGTLLLHAHMTEGNAQNGVPTMATDGHSIFVNNDFAKKLDDDEFCGVLLHEVLHMALKHVVRSSDLTDKVLLNVAADIIVNGILKDNNITLPKDAIYDDKLSDKSLHEIYWILKSKQQKSGNPPPQANTCLRPDLGEEGKKARKQDQGDGGGGDGEGNGEGEGDSNFEVEWDDVLTKAETINRMNGRSLSGGGLERLFKELNQPKLNWRDILYRYITTFPCDFTGYDRRFLHDDCYFEDLDGHKNEVLVYIDTSGSVSSELLKEFISEIRGAVNVTPNISGDIFQFDTKLYPMGDIKEFSQWPHALGGGGTDFDLCIDSANKRRDEVGNMSNILVIIMTDGYAPIPKAPEGYTVLWAVCPNGPKDDYFTFGEVVRIL